MKYPLCTTCIRWLLICDSFPFSYFLRQQHCQVISACTGQWFTIASMQQGCICCSLGVFAGELACCDWEICVWERSQRHQISATQFCHQTGSRFGYPSMRKMRETPSCSSAISGFLSQVYCSAMKLFQVTAIHAIFCECLIFSYLLPSSHQTSTIRKCYQISSVMFKKTALCNYLGFSHSVLRQEDLNLLESSVCTRDKTLIVLLMT